jgi:hypothetical protein
MSHILVEPRGSTLKIDHCLFALIDVSDNRRT